MITHIFREVKFYADFLASIGLKCKSYRIFNFVHEDLSTDFLLDKLGTLRLRICL